VTTNNGDGTNDVKGAATDVKGLDATKWVGEDVIGRMTHLE